MGVSAPSLHRESTDSLIHKNVMLCGAESSLLNTNYGSYKVNISETQMKKSYSTAEGNSKTKLSCNDVCS